MRTETRRQAALLTLLVLFTAACATGMRRERPDQGTVTVGVTTSGRDLTGLTFRVTVDPAGIGGSVKAEVGVFTRDHVGPGDHAVRLLDVPARCRVDGGPERTISLSRQRPSAVLRFRVVCD